MPNTPSDPAVRAWIRIMRVQQTAARRIERAFREAGLPPYAWYDALWELERAGPAGLRPFEIERQMLIAQSNISRLIDRLEATGCVARRPCEQDGRGQTIVITEEGSGLRARMWPVYAAVISAVVSSQLTDPEADSLAGMLDRLLERA